MKLHFEATEHISHEGIIDLDEDQAAEYRALTNEAERYTWLKDLVIELVDDDLHQVARETDNEFAYVTDDEPDGSTSDG